MMWMTDCRIRYWLIVGLTLIGIFDVLWQRENSEMVAHETIHGSGISWVAARFYPQHAYVMDREIRPREHWDTRHKLRWVYKGAEVSVYKFAEEHASQTIARYVSLLHYVGIFSLAYLFCLLILREATGKVEIAQIFIASLAFLGLMSSIFHIAGWQENYTPIEMLAVAAAIYTSQVRKPLYFFGVILIAVFNRESGIAIGLIYPILNPDQRWLWVAGPLFGAIILVLFNLDLLTQPAFYEPSNFVVHGDVVRLSFNNFYQFPISKWSPALLHYLAFVAPALLLAPGAFNNSRGKGVLAIFGIYFVIFSLGSFLDNAYLFLIYIPIYFAIYGYAVKKSSSPVSGTISAV